MSCIEKDAHDVFYQGGNDLLHAANTVDDYVQWYHGLYLSPFHRGGITKGYVRNQAVEALLQAVALSGKNYNQVRVLDAGCGQGGLSVYLACLGFEVIAVDLSEVACADARTLAKKLAVDNRCVFHATSLADIPEEDHSIDYIIGHASLHHFIKYREIPAELSRISKPGCEGFFADSYGENPIYRLFHNKEQMTRLGDVSLTKPMVEDYFNPLFSVQMIPADWFAMLDKLWLKVLPRSSLGLARAMAKVHHSLDRCIPISSRIALRLSGSAMTHIKRLG
jgi:2-polyprenyl-3-methyl-5-hydroxy-6-metoxy-1,4-benzoquinol methylase